MRYVTYTEVVKTIISKTKNYPLLDFEINVDGSFCLLVRNEAGKYFEKKYGYSTTKISAQQMSEQIIKDVENYFGVDC